jgi:hypothetical protein
LARRASLDSFFGGGVGDIPGGRFMDSPVVYAYNADREEIEARDLARPMSKRELYESIINFRTSVDTTLEDDKIKFVEPH